MMPVHQLSLIVHCNEVDVIRCFNGWHEVKGEWTHVRDFTFFLLMLNIHCLIACGRHHIVMHRSLKDGLVHVVEKQILLGDEFLINIRAEPWD